MDSAIPSREEEVRRRLLDHYDRHGRDLPWRHADDPYPVWVSEVMLQQTRVETVIPYYRRWMERFPGVEELAAAEQEEVLQEWKGLGYYSRARNLHRAARLVRERHGGRLPATAEGLRELPGVGPYTAGAVASIAFDEPVPAVDGNVRRVLSRLYDLEDPGAADLERRAAALVDPERPGCFNQALMDLGATLCTPSSPECGSCPLEELCVARERGTVEERPAGTRTARVRRIEIVVAVPVDPRGRTLLVRRPQEGLLGGMWEFPGAELPASPGDPGAQPVEARAGAVARGMGVEAGPGEVLEPVTHRFTHLHATYRPVLLTGARLPEADPGGAGASPDGPGEPGSAAGEDSREGSRPVRVVPLDDLDGHPLPVAQQKIGEAALRATRGPEGVR